MSIRIKRLISELSGQSIEYKAARLEEELLKLVPVDELRLHENALLMTELREVGLWPPPTI